MPEQLEVSIGNLGPIYKAALKNLINVAWNVAVVFGKPLSGCELYVFAA